MCKSATVLGSRTIGESYARSQKEFPHTKYRWSPESERQNNTYWETNSLCPEHCPKYTGTPSSQGRQPSANSGKQTPSVARYIFSPHLRPTLQ